MGKGGGDLADLNKVLSQNLKRYRDEFEISQEELAGRSGISTRSYGDIERGRVNTSLEIVDRLAAATGLSASELLDENLDLNEIF